MKVKVRCTYILEVEIPDDCDPEFTIEDNCCPGSGAVGGALRKLMEKHEAPSAGCWACACGGSNVIVPDGERP
jgi:hypothetical protein